MTVKANMLGSASYSVRKCESKTDYFWNQQPNFFRNKHWISFRRYGVMMEEADWLSVLHTVMFLVLF